MDSGLTITIPSPPMQVTVRDCYGQEMRDSGVTVA